MSVTIDLKLLTFFGVCSLLTITNSYFFRAARPPLDRLRKKKAAGPKPRRHDLIAISAAY
ncbi:hypothetical protein [Bradyrhizobium genosp. SA-3]|uniref:hypothetical protein n=1 Tax=Bradyrhizobium genosp. SA-3 TaxID=508868 RepID=UPI001028DDCC|nr:hypothetical protein [Bradyrhizobium genosp. SA-3]